MNERATMNFKRRGYAPSAPSAGEALYARMLAARRIHNGPEHDALVESLRAIVARGLAKTLSRVRANAAARVAQSLSGSQL